MFKDEKLNALEIEGQPIDMLESIKSFSNGPYS